jgi:hypothetical protein
MPHTNQKRDLILSAPSISWLKFIVAIEAKPEVLHLFFPCALQKTPEQLNIREIEKKCI